MTEWRMTDEQRVAIARAVWGDDYDENYPPFNADAKIDAHFAAAVRLGYLVPAQENGHE
jgi:hypothetical protein